MYYSYCSYIKKLFCKNVDFDFDIYQLLIIDFKNFGF